MLSDLRNRELINRITDKFVNDIAGLSEEDFVRVCVMAGCDYLPSIHGIGLKTAAKIFAKTLATSSEKRLAEAVDQIRISKRAAAKKVMRKHKKGKNEEKTNTELDLEALAHICAPAEYVTAVERVR